MYILSIFSVNTFVAFTLHHYFNDIKFYENAIFERNPFSAATAAVYPRLLPLAVLLFLPTTLVESHANKNIRQKWPYKCIY
jgi:hypothetical protein